MRMIVVTGMSGAGKSTALKMLEDIGYFCVDNLPVPLVPKLADMICSQHVELEKIALGIDIRSGQRFDELQDALEELKKAELNMNFCFWMLRMMFWLNVIRKQEECILWQSRTG